MSDTDKRPDETDEQHAQRLQAAVQSSYAELIKAAGDDEEAVHRARVSAVATIVASAVDLVRKELGECGIQSSHIGLGLIVMAGTYAGEHAPPAQLQELYALFTDSMEAGLRARDTKDRAAETAIVEAFAAEKGVKVTTGKVGLTVTEVKP